MTQRIHQLKTWPEYFDSIINGVKTFELRKNDRDYQVDDYLLLKRYDPIGQCYTGDEVKVRITYILNGGSFGLKKRYCVMGINISL